MAALSPPSDKVTFWYGCNVVRHGDIIYNAIALLEAVGMEVTPAGGAGYCCGTKKDANLTAAQGMGRRNVEKFNAHNTGQVVSWCPSCYRHMNAFISQYTEPQFDLSHFIEILYERRDWLATKLIHPVTKRVLLHQHLGFHEVDINPMVIALLRLIPGLELMTTSPLAPAHMCSELSRVPASLKVVNQQTCESMRRSGADTLATVFHSCQRLLCGLEASESFTVVNYVNLLAQSMGLVSVDEYKDWKLAGTAQAVIDRLGPDRVAKMGEPFFHASILPELLSPPIK
jgi:hypothetical protein